MYLGAGLSFNECGDGAGGAARHAALRRRVFRVLTYYARYDIIGA